MRYGGCAVLLAMLVAPAAAKKPAIKEPPRPSQPSSPSEVQSNLTRLASTAMIYFMEHSKFPPPSNLTPKDACCATGGECTDEPALWLESPTWTGLQFSLTKHRYQYSFTSEGEGTLATFVVRAVGDPRCSGKSETWEIAGKVVGGAVVSDKRVRLVKK